MTKRKRKKNDIVMGGRRETGRETKSERFGVWTFFPTLTKKK